ncbi:preprotein translocase subunit YajC [Ruminococcaceae bacterium AM07-15]|nr:preprotein translocase subunit YajC [Ruminococcaceae bacterium AM07-15]
MEWTAYIWIVATFAIFYLLLIRPQQKREKKERIMRNSLEAGDHIVTIGGIVGKIISVKEDEIVIETGADRTKLTMKKWCVQAKENGEEKK